ERLLKLPIKIEEKQSVSDFLKSQRLSNFVAFNPNTSDLAIERLWQSESFAELGKRLLDTFPDLQIVLIGAKADVVRVMGLQKSIEISDRVVSTAGKFTIRETTELLSHARVLVSNDSGPMHLGVVAGVPTVGLFGPETPVLYGPRGDNHIAITAGEMCSPCISVYNEKVVDCCRGVVCMKNISVESVFQAVVERLAAVQPNVTFREFSELPLTKQRIDS
ncbi:MAG: glycosyltransferase family 9 protein, partial [Calditrichaeota bacterium]|nr:glycosyltransferase family 9 protein [Calditrichota bacterium]